MNVRVLLFAAARQAAGADAMDLELPEAATVDDALARLGGLHPSLAPVLGSCRAAVDETFARGSTALAEGSVLAILPPVSGG